MVAWPSRSMHITQKQGGGEEDVFVLTSFVWLKMRSFHVRSSFEHKRSNELVNLLIVCPSVRSANTTTAIVNRRDLYKGMADQWRRFFLTRKTQMKEWLRQERTSQTLSSCYSFCWAMFVLSQRSRLNWVASFRFDSSLSFSFVYSRVRRHSTKNEAFRKQNNNTDRNDCRQEWSSVTTNRWTLSTTEHLLDDNTKQTKEK